MFDVGHLDGANCCKFLLDLGCGCAKLALQSFFQFPKIEQTIAVELSQVRYGFAVERLRHFAQHNTKILEWREGHNFVEFRLLPNKRYGITTMRTFMVRNENLFDSDIRWVNTCDILVCETAMPAVRRGDLGVLLTKLKPGCRFLLYHGFRKLPGIVVNQKNAMQATLCMPTLAKNNDPNAVEARLSEDSKLSNTDSRDSTHLIWDINLKKPLATFQEIAPNDGYFTSWSTSNNGYPFNTWAKIADGGTAPPPPTVGTG